MMMPTSRAAAVTIFVGCMGRKETCTEPGCAKTASRACQAPLRGRKAGLVCGREICSGHGGDRCGPHRRAGA